MTAFNEKDIQRMQQTDEWCIAWWNDCG